MSLTNAHPEFRKLDLDGLKILVSWAEKEGWNPGPYDAEAFYVTDPEGFYGYFIDDRMIGGGSIVSYDGAFGFMGFFIVDPAFRGKGLGKKLWYLRRDTLLSRLQPGASVGMDGVLDMQPFYQKGGFEIAFRDERHVQVGRIFQLDEQIHPVQNRDIDTIAFYDLKCFGFSRYRFLEKWLSLPQTKAFKFLDGESLLGYAAIRKAATGWKIGPLFANEPEVATALYEACLDSAKGDEVFLDIPLSNPHAIEMTKKYGTTYVFECARMYYGKAPDLPLDKIYGITTFELG